MKFPGPTRPGLENQSDHLLSRSPHHIEGILLRWATGRRTWSFNEKTTQGAVGALMKAASIALLLVVLFPRASRSQSQFDGTWVIDTNKNRNFAAEKPIAFSRSMGCFGMAIGWSRPMAKIRKVLGVIIGIQSASASWTTIRSR